VPISLQSAAARPDALESERRPLQLLIVDDDATHFIGVKRRAEIGPVSSAILQDLAGVFRIAAALRAHAIMVSLGEAAPGRFFLFFPFRNWTSISVPLTRTSSHRR
jgi:hypothetical protein